MMKPRLKLPGICIPLVVLALAVIISANAAAERVVFNSGLKRVSLLELFTSEGCSSCPPADDWLSRLKNSPGLWSEFIPVAYHVDYWNRLGWKDRWSSPEFSKRQSAYARIWRNQNLYTPCFGLNGNEWRGWSRRRNVPRASDENVGVLSISSTDTNHWYVSFIPANKSGAKYEVHAALLAGELTSDVKAGENRGRQLRHDFVVVDFVDAIMNDRHGTASGSFDFDISRHSSEKVLALALWVSLAGQLEPMQATGGWLALPTKPAKH